MPGANQTTTESNKKALTPSLAVSHSHSQTMRSLRSTLSSGSLDTWSCAVFTMIRELGWVESYSNAKFSKRGPKRKLQPHYTILQSVKEQLFKV